ncbi:MAG: hypothetical protein AAF492_27015, partial [Verrucomicrobiota bacterium]
KAGWGSEDFEKTVTEETDFPEAWTSKVDRELGWEIIQDHLGLLEEARQARLTLLRNGYKLSEIEVERNDKRKLGFKVKLYNGTTGHPVPTGFDAERLVWLHVIVKDSEGEVVFQSGDLDPNGDVRDLHSSYVHDHKLPLDKQLVSLQSRFLTRNIRGGEREEILPINHSFSPLPFVRPPTRPIILSGQPDDVRKHRKVIPPGGHRWAEYTVPRRDLGEAGPWQVVVELKAAMVPVNLVHTVKEMGFDFGMTTDEVVENLMAGHEVLWTRQATVPSPE